MTPEELAAIEITPEGLRRVANAPCYGERTDVLRRTADRLEQLEAVGKAVHDLFQTDVAEERWAILNRPVLLAAQAAGLADD